MLRAKISSVCRVHLVDIHHGIRVGAPRSATIIAGASHEQQPQQQRTHDFQLLNHPHRQGHAAFNMLIGKLIK